MRLVRVVPFKAKVGTEADKKDTLAPLGDAIVRGIQDAADHAIGKVALRALAGVVLFKPREVLRPTLALPAPDFGIRKLEIDVLVVVGERLPREPFHVLEKEGARTHLTDGAHGLGPHIARVPMRLVLATQGERLAGRTARNKIDDALVFTKVDLPHVAIEQLPGADNRMALVLADRVATIAVNLDDGLCLEAGARDAHAEAAGPREQFDGAMIVCFSLAVGKGHERTRCLGVRENP